MRSRCKPVRFRVLLLDKLTKLVKWWAIERLFWASMMDLVRGQGSGATTFRMG